MIRFAPVLLCFAALRLASGQIVINEILYDPRPKTELTEYIELFNAGAESVNLEGWRFTSGLSYTFPEGASLEPGEYLILAQNVPGYQKKFGSIFVGGLAAFGEFESGSLANEGERIALEDAEGELIDEVTYRSTFPWPIAPQGAAVLANGDGVSMELLHPALDNDLGGSWRAAERPTPGKVNSVFAAIEEVPPQVRQVGHVPQAPVTGEEVIISTKVTDPDGVVSVTLRYQHLEPGAYIRLTDDAYESEWTALVMKDDGQGPDEVAEDGVYAVSMPAEMTRHRHLVRYRLEATDALGNTVRVPYADDPQPNFAYFTYDGVPSWKGAVEPGETPEITFSEETMNSIAVYHLIATEADIEAQQWGNADREWYGTVVYGGEVYDHMTFSKRGRASRGQVGKEKWDWNFNRGHRFQAHDNYGRPYDLEWREINVLPGTNPWWRNDRSTDGTILNESVGFRVFQLIGSPASNTSFFQLRVIDSAAEAPANQYDGDLWGLYIAIQDPDSRFLQERELPDGNIYNWHGNGDVQKNQGVFSVSDGSDQRDFKANLRASTDLEWWKAHLNFEAYYAFNCGNLLINNADMRPNDNMMSYYHPNGQCYPIPWDLDLTFEDAPHLGRGDTPAWENIYRVLSHEEVDIPYQNRIRELLSLLFNGEQSSMLVDEYARFVWIDVPQSERVRVSELGRDGSTAVLTTSEPHGFASGDLITIEGIDEAVYNGDKAITVISETQFSFKGSLFAPDPTGDLVFAYRAPDQKPLVLMDQAMWDYHPRKRKEGIYYTNIEGNDREDFKGYQAYMKAFMAPGGYGHELLASHAEEADAPEMPSITYLGGEGFAVTDLRFEVSEFEGGSLFSPQAFAAVQWRLAETTDLGSPNFDPEVPRRYEIDADWVSDEIAPFQSTMQIPPGVPRPGHFYSVRARMKNDAGHWSLWSDPIRFVVEAPDVESYTQSLRLSELMYHPRAASAEEQAQGYSEQDFEYIELVNVGDATLDLMEVRFTKGVDFDFAGSTVTELTPGERVLVVANLAAFAHRYPQVAESRIAGTFTRQLSNGGENVKLSFGAGTPIWEFTYDDADGWPEEADGEGFALLAPTDPELDLNDPAAWRVTAAVDGSPGAAEPDGGGGEPRGYAVWRGAAFEGAEIEDEAISGPEADPDGDGRLNWMEYALGRSPKLVDNASLRASFGEGSQVVVSHPLAESQDVNVRYEQSSNLLDWEPVVPAMTSQDGGEREATFLSVDQVRFLRLHLTFEALP